ncbi:MAG TPA: LysR family transcriptional regulator [Methylibium sp.]|uniref:LysR family transcriptional regulator n=1 Tax=Methylibium sp. TaxID=2067992 RepID=UPI002DB6CF53|nr:LysR family transcriptional regulator [Methylibium sp.]HEU4460393.1 LysR family transcriptional regulator [Methylibium sp.]
MDQLRSMRVFVAVIDAGSFIGAAAAQRMSPAAVTRHVADLEEHLGARLINRTTRRLALTEVGEAYLDKARQILTEIEEAEALAGASTREPRGHLRVLTSPAIAVHQLAKHLPRFQQLHPQVTLEVSAPGPVETVDENFDVSIMTSRKPLQGEFVARRLARSEVIICAAPEYLDRKGRPEHPNDLARMALDAIVPPLSELQNGLSFERGTARHGEPPGESVTIVPRRSVLSTTHIDTMYAAALAGLGIAGLPSYVIEDALLENALERVLPQWHLWSATIWAGMPSRKHIPTRTRAFVDFLVATFGGEDRDPWLLAAGCETGAPAKQHGVVQKV